MSGIPYFLKNTTTLERVLKPLTPEETLREGDLIKITGHVMVVADLENNTLIEARGYQDGYGKVHEIALPLVFKGINSYQDLLDAYYAKKTLIRLNSDGKESQIFPTFNLLRLESAWQES